jgi:hypothetical protein
MILIKNFYAFILYVSDSGLQCNKHNSYWYGIQYQDRQTARGSWYGPVKMILPPPPPRTISFPLVHTTTLGQSVYPDIALHISNYYISIMSYLRYLCLFAYRGVQHILCCVFLSSFCQFLWIVHFWLFLRYSLMFISCI